MASTTRVAIVTGAAQGLGRAICLRLANDGLDIVVNDLPSKATELEKLVAEIHGKHKQRRARAVVGDVTVESEVQKLVNTAVEEFGSLDVMVANAGIGRNGSLTTTTVEEWDLVQTVNVRSVFLCYKAAAIQMIKQGRGGRIVGASSMAGKKGAPEWASYCASKFAVRGLTQSAAIELRAQGITVNAYAPSAVDTPIWNEIEDSRESHGLNELRMEKNDARLTHFGVGLGRVGAGSVKGLPKEMVLSSEDVAGLVSYLVSEEARFVTGQSMNINAGQFFD